MILDEIQNIVNIHLKSGKLMWYWVKPVNTPVKSTPFLPTLANLLMETWLHHYV